MNKYKITYSVTIEAESQQEAMEIFFDSVQSDGEMLQCVKINSDTKRAAPPDNPYNRPSEKFKL
jgi:hypothetical protein